MNKDEFLKDLAGVINKHSAENGSDTPDMILALFLYKCLEAFDNTTNMRTGWYKAEAETETKE